MVVGNWLSGKVRAGKNVEVGISALFLGFTKDCSLKNWNKSTTK